MRRESARTIASSPSRATWLGALLLLLLPATACKLPFQGEDNKAAANPQTTTPPTTTALTSDTAMTSDAAMTSDTAPAADAGAAAAPAETPATAAADTGGDTASGQAQVTSVGVFQQQLSPYGRWVVSADYGEVWVPRIAAGWRPYTTGHWVYTDDGWAWVADERWGWATFHYGRWYYASGYGWAWVPGTVWAPAWVAWRSGGGYVGWAALPPTVGYDVSVGVELGGVEIAPAYYSFCSEGSILAPSLTAVIVAPERNVVLLRGSTDITRYSVAGGRIVNTGVDVRHIEQVTGHPVMRTQIAGVGAPGMRLGGNRVGFFRPAAIAAAAVATHAEFGRAMHAQVAAERAHGLTGRPAFAGSAGAPHRGPAVAAAPGRFAGRGAPASGLASHSATVPGRAAAGAGHPPSSAFGATHHNRTSTPAGASTFHGTTGTAHAGQGAPHTTASTLHSRQSTFHSTTGTAHGGSSGSHGTTGTSHTGQSTSHTTTGTAHTGQSTFHATTGTSHTGQPGGSVHSTQQQQQHQTKPPPQGSARPHKPPL